MRAVGLPCANPRIESDEAIEKLSSSEREYTEPIAARPRALKAEPTRTNPRTDRLLPTCAKRPAESPAGPRAKPRNERLEAIALQAATESTVRAFRLRPAWAPTERLEPQRTKCRSDTALPSVEKLVIEACIVTRQNERSDNELPSASPSTTLVAANNTVRREPESDNVEPKRAYERIDMAEPMAANWLKDSAELQRAKPRSESVEPMHMQFNTLRVAPAAIVLRPAPPESDRLEPTRIKLRTDADDHSATRS
jgi:hypothetical protein